VRTEIGSDRILVVIRHGQTDWNVEERFQGRLDVPLNAVGRSQALKLKVGLAGIPFDRVYSSPLRRALHTAWITAGNRAVTLEPLLTEVHHGLWQGRTKREILCHWPDQWECWQSQRQPFTPRDGEPARYVGTRVEEFLHSMKGSNILCVSHGVVIQNFLAILSGSPLSPDVPPNGSIHTFRFRNRNLNDYHVASGSAI